MKKIKLKDNNAAAYVYTISCPITGNIVYVGQTIDPVARFYSHSHPKEGKTALQKWVTDLLSKDFEPEFNIIKICRFDEVLHYERHYINLLKKTNDLLNVQINKYELEDQQQSSKLSFDQAISRLLQMEDFNKDLVRNKKLQIYAKRWANGEGGSSAMKYLEKYGFTVDYQYEQPEKQPE